MAINMNLDLGSMMKGMSGKGSNLSTAGLIAKMQPFKKSIILFLVTIVIFSIYFSAYYLPMRKENLKKIAEIQKLNDMEKQSVELTGKIGTLRKKLGDSKEEYIQSLSHFGNSEDLGELYQSISTLAAKYDIVVMNIKEVPPVEDKSKKKEAKSDDAKSKDKKAGDKKDAKKDDKKTDEKKADSKKDSNKKVAAKVDETPKTPVKEILVAVELKGQYGQYIKFKEDLAIAEMLLKINSETLKVKSDKAEPGKIYVELNLSTYAIDKKPFQKVIDENESKKNDI